MCATARPLALRSHIFEREHEVPEEFLNTVVVLASQSSYKSLRALPVQILHQESASVLNSGAGRGVKE
jgi:hypothetical protein